MIVFADIKAKEWRWPHFSRERLMSKDNGECRMDPLFLDILEQIRLDLKEPLLETSGYRSPTYNAKVSHTGAMGPHTTGRAIDIAVRGGTAFRLVKLAVIHGMTGIGVSQKGKSRFIHLDDLDAPEFPRPTIWSY